MVLYHYGAPGFITLKTLEAQRKISGIERKEALEMQRARHNVAPGLYYQHISFLFDPIEDDHWRYFNPSHPVWRKRATLTQYTVDSSKIRDFKWMIVETPEIVEARYDDSVTDKEFWNLYVQVNQEKYVGSGNPALEKAANEFVGRQKEYLRKAHQRNPNSTRYAADVPHVMIYPKNSMVKFVSQKTIELK